MPGSGILTITSSQFTGNTAGCAGALWSTDSGRGEDLVFRNNVGGTESVGTGGGAVGINRHTSGTTSWTFNRVLFDNNVTGGVGGAMDADCDQSTTVTVSNGVFTNNRAGPNAGAISHSPSTPATCALYVNDSTFDGNSVTGSGGSVIHFIGGGNASLNRVRLRNNTGGAGVIQGDSSPINVSINCLLELSNNTPNTIDSRVTITSNNCRTESTARPEPDPEPEPDYAEQGRENRRELLAGTGIEVDSAQAQVWGNHLQTADGQPHYAAIGEPKLANLGVSGAVDITG